MYLNPIYDYPTLERVTLPSGVRHYICPQTGAKLPSVTTILSATGCKKQLLEWKQRVGEAKAEQERKQATDLGTLMHTHLECHILGRPRPGGNNLIRVMAQNMADQIIEHGLKDITEVHGNEVALYYPGLFAGTTDGVGIWRDQPCIFDFKTAKKMRTRAMIEDYLLQTAAYGLAHNAMYGTRIKTGVIFMASRDLDFQTFVISGDEFEQCQLQFLDRLERFVLH